MVDIASIICCNVRQIWLMMSHLFRYLSDPIITFHGPDPTTQAISCFGGFPYNLRRELRNCKKHTNLVDDFGIYVVLVESLQRCQELAVCQHSLSWSPIIIHLLSWDIRIVDPLGFDLHSVEGPICNRLVEDEFKAEL